MEDPSAFVVAEAGAISSSQDEFLRRSRFVLQPRPRPSSSPPSSSSSSGPSAVPFRISHHPITMRSASESHSSCHSSDTCRGGGEGLGFPRDGNDRLLGRKGEKRSSISKKKHSAEEGEAEKGGSWAVARRGKRPRALSDESTQEHGAVSSAEAHRCGCRDGLDSPVVSPRGKVVARRLGFGGIGKERAKSARDGDLHTGAESRDRTMADDEFAKFRFVKSNVTPPTRKGAAMCLRRLPHSIEDTVGGRGEEGSGSSARVYGSSRSEEERVVEVDPHTSVRLRSPQPPEVERPPPATELGTSSGLQSPKQPETRAAPERSPGVCVHTPPPPPPPEEAATKMDEVGLLIRLSKKPDTRRLQDVDLLEVFAMKGIHISPPRWWRPGGYHHPPKKVG